MTPRRAGIGLWLELVAVAPRCGRAPHRADASCSPRSRCGPCGSSPTWRAWPHGQGYPGFDAPPGPRAERRGRQAARDGAAVGRRGRRLPAGHLRATCSPGSAPRSARGAGVAAWRLRPERATHRRGALRALSAGVAATAPAWGDARGRQVDLGERRRPGDARRAARSPGDRGPRARAIPSEPARLVWRAWPASRRARRVRRERLDRLDRALRVGGRPTASPSRASGRAAGRPSSRGSRGS